MKKLYDSPRCGSYTEKVPVNELTAAILERMGVLQGQG